MFFEVLGNTLNSILLFALHIDSKNVWYFFFCPKVKKKGKSTFWNFFLKCKKNDGSFRPKWIG